MKQPGFYSALIQSLEDLYMRVAASLARHRMNDYHRDNKIDRDIRRPLIQCLSRISHIPDKQVDPEMHMDYSILEQPARNGDTRTEHDKLHDTVDDIGNIHELSDYFREMHNNSSLHPGIREKLIHSVWEHIHDAINCAHNADEQNATMHANAASCACEELAHYMDDDEYRAFVEKIEQYSHSLLTAMEH